MNYLREANADAMLICLVFLVVALSTVKIANATSSMQIVLNTIQLIEATQGSIKNVMGKKESHPVCDQIAQTRVNVEV